MDKGVLHRWGNPDTILLASNLEDAPHLVPHAIAQARCSDSKVLLVHIIEPAYVASSPVEGQPFVFPGPLVHSVQMNLNQIVKQFQQEGILCEPIILEGIPGEQLSGFVKERGVDRVIVGTRSSEAMERALVGSVAEDLLHEVDVPVCVIGPRVRPQVRPDYEPSSILFATSLRRKCQQSTQLALEIANLHQARLTLLHVMPSGQAEEKDYHHLHDQRRDELLNLITEGTKIWSLPSIAIREGDAATEILAEADKLAADLIVLGTTGASKVVRLLAAGVVHRVIAMTKAPVITLRQEQHIPDVYTDKPLSVKGELTV